MLQTSIGLGKGGGASPSLGLTYYLQTLSLKEFEKRSLVPQPLSFPPSKVHLTWLQATDEVLRMLGCVLQAGVVRNHRHPFHQGVEG